MFSPRRVVGPVVVLLLGAVGAYAGPLNPPSGPIASTQKPLAEVEPRIAINATNTPGDADSLLRIAVPGSYYLTGNVTGVAAKRGIEIASSGVTIDLNGFDLAGVPGSLDGITTTVASLVNIEVHSGSIRNWGGHGIDSGLAEGAVFRELRCSDNAGSGIRAGAGAALIRCTVGNNGALGIFTSFSCRIVDCVAIDNTDDGISAGSGSTVSGCSAYSNQGDGLFVSTGCTIANNTSRGNDLNGIRVSTASFVTGNTCSNNGQSAKTGAGIYVGASDNRIDANHCFGQDRGIHVVAGGNVIIRNTCTTNATNWDIAINNYYGPIINRSGVATAGVLGDAAGGTLASTDPHANFTY